VSKAAKAGLKTDGSQVAEANQRLLEVGAILLPDATVGAQVPVTTQEVRSYRHFVLGERTVAKVASHDVGEAIDATMDFLGFGEAQNSGPIGIALHGSLGFPESALIADPSNARYALAVVKDLNRLGRMAKSRAGAAKEGMENLAATLAKSVPQFLPSYFEQCGRLFIAQENVTYGGAMFVKARAAETTYGLAIDEDRRRQAFLEFAFAGALPAKALDEYAKDLAKVYEPSEAFGHFRALVLQRSRGGLAPWAQMMDVVKRMAKAASVNVDAAQAELLSELFGSPSLRFASQTFWKSVRSLVIERAKTDPVVRGSLLNLHPSGDFGQWWVELLDECGALESLSVLSDSDLPEPLRVVGGPASWMNRTIANAGTRGFSSLPKLLEQGAQRLKADGQPLQFHQWNMSVDALDHALELGIPCAAPDHNYFTYAFDKPFSRTLQNLANASNLERFVRRSVYQCISNKQTTHLISTPSLQPFTVDWIEDRLCRIGAARPLDGNHGTVDTDASSAANGVGAYDFVNAAQELITFVTPEMLALVPDAAQRLARIDLANTVARQCRIGIFAEFAWPAFEKACAELAHTPHSIGQALSQKPAAANAIALAESWPQLIVFDDRRALVVDHDEIIYEHDLQWKADSWRKSLLFVDGSLFVGWFDYSTGVQGYWSNNPSQVLSDGVDIPYRMDVERMSLPIDTGGRTRGQRAIHVGDAAADSPVHVVSDGQNFWVVDTFWENGVTSTRCLEFDPATGKKGRYSFPTFVESHLTAGKTVTALQLVPLPPSCASTPFSSQDGLIGATVMTETNTETQVQTHEVIRIDGVRSGPIVDTSGSRHQVSAVSSPVQLLNWPGISKPYLVTAYGKVVLTADGDDAGGANASFVSWSATWPTLDGVVIPVNYWHHFVVRDASGSQSLRQVTGSQVSGAIAEVVQRVNASTPSAPFDKNAADANLAQLLTNAIPGVNDPVLVTAIATMIAEATVAKLDLDAWLGGKQRDGAVVALASLSDEEEQPLRNAGDGIVHRSYRAMMRTQLQALHRMFTASLGTTFTFDYSVGAALADLGLTAHDLLVGVPALAFAALLPSASAAERAAVLDYLDMWLAGPFSVPGKLTVATVVVSVDPHRRPAFTWGPDGAPWVFGLATAMVDEQTNKSMYYFEVLVGSPQPQLLTEFDVLQTTEPIALVSKAQVAALVKLIREKDAVVDLNAEAVSAFANAAGRSVAESAVILGGMRGLSYGSTELTKEQRETFGVKAAEVKRAATAIADLDRSKTQRALIDAMYADPESLWTLTPAQLGDRFGAAWAKAHGAMSLIDDGLLARTEKVLGNYPRYKPRELLTDFDGSVPRMRDRVMSRVEASGNIVNTPKGSAPDGIWITSVVRTAAVIANDQPIGDPWRVHAGNAILRLREQLRNPELILHWSSVYAESPSVLRAVDGLPMIESDGGRIYDGGDTIAVARSFVNGIPNYFAFFVRPGRSNEEPSALRVLADSYFANEYATGSTIEWLFSDRADHFVQHLLSDNVSNGFDQNPLVSVPTLVAEVAKVTELNEHAASLFLQLLTLAEPTSVRIKEWNGWTGKELSAATQSLLDGGFVTAAKRAGSGRDVFLSGGWVEMRAPAIGIEAWKLPLYAISSFTSSKQSAQTGRVLPLDPIPTLFATAWARWQSGDRPGFAEAGPGLGERKKKK
jgi:hypothetical protein